MGGTFKARQIVEEEQFAQEKKNLRHSAARLDEILFGITWVMARRPDSFPQVPGLKLYVARTDSFPGAPPLHVWFTFDDTNVHLLSIEEMPLP
jgi:hypothetical protein